MHGSVLLLSWFFVIELYSSFLNPMPLGGVQRKAPSLTLCPLFQLEIVARKIKSVLPRLRATIYDLKESDNMALCITGNIIFSIFLKPDSPIHNKYYRFGLCSTRERLKLFILYLCFFCRI